MKKFLIITVLLLSVFKGFNQVAVFSDDFNRPDNTTVGNGWTENETTASGAQILSNQLVLGSTTAGREFLNRDVSSLYTTNGITSNSRVITWAFNFRNTRPDPSGFNGSGYGIAFILGKTTSTIIDGEGYAVVIGQNTATDPIRLAHFTGGPDVNSNFTDIISGGDYGTEYISVRVTYNPISDEWSLFAESNASAFPQTDPKATSTQVGSTVVNTTYTSGNDLKYLGPFWNHGISGSDNAVFDDVSIYLGTLSSDYFRTRQSGNWNATTTWEFSIDNSTWGNATLTPDNNANTITILNGHLVTVTANVTTDQTFVSPSAALAVTGAGVALTVVNTGLTFQSTVSGTARHANSTGSITGDVTVERYIGAPSARRAWRFLTAPLRGSGGTIAANWQSNFGSAGVGTNISGPSGSGFDYTSPGYSLKRYNITTQLYEGVTNTGDNLFTSSASAANLPYMIFIAGDKTLNITTNPGSNNTTLRAVGALQTGQQVFSNSLTMNKFMPVGNPYASAVDFGSVDRVNTPKKFWTWDPNLNTFGGYVLVDDTDDENGVYSVIPNSPTVPTSGGATGGSTAQTSDIQSGQSFFVQALNTAITSITFEESDKSPNVINNVFRQGNGTYEELRVNLELVNADNTFTLADGVLEQFDNTYSLQIDEKDGYKFTNTNENLSIVSNSKNLMLERRPLINAGEIIKLNLANTTARNYRFAIYPTNMNSSALTAFLEDGFLKTSTPISLTEVTNVPFAVTSDAASAAGDRFQIVFKASSVLPVGFTTVKAFQKNQQIEIDWSVATETNIRYEIEKSFNGRDFEKAGSVNASAYNNSASYKWTDMNSKDGNNYYRIKGFAQNGEIKYSAIVNVKLGRASSIVVYPNPIKERTLSLQLNNQPEGIYTVRMTNNLGQQVFLKTIGHAGGSAAQTLNLNSNVVKGVYQLQVSNGETTINQKVICN